MGLVMTEICLDVNDLAGMTRFWSGVLQLSAAEVTDEGAEFVLSPGLVFLLLPVPEAKSVKNRLHLDLSPRGADQSAEVARVEALGATRVDVGQGGEVSWVVLADPEGNEFCILAGRRDD